MYACYRFATKLRTYGDLLDSCLDRVTAALHEAHPDMGQNVVIDGSDLPAYANGQLDSGLKILDALQRVPTEVNVVYAPRVDVFEDADGTHQRVDVHGVVLKTEGSEDLRVFPTTRDHHREGERVAWDWNMNETWPESWYRNPDTGRIEYAWTLSAEFIGTRLAEVY